MFRLLHKIYIGFCWLAVLAVVAVLIHHHALFYPLVDLVDALQVREGLEQQKSGEISGTVARVLSGDTFILREERGQTQTIRLTGVEAPGYDLNNPVAQ